MAGHSKWAKVKRIKAVVDVRRGRVFSRLSREITIAARSGGSDPAMNPRLRTLLLKARDANMPADNIERAIKKGTGELSGTVYEELTYEGYGPGGVAMIVKVATDNKNRTAADVRSVFARFGGNLAGAGAVSFLFRHAGQFLVSRSAASEDALIEVALEAGAEDIISTADGFEIRCDVRSYDQVAQALEQKAIRTESAEIAYIPTSTVPVADAGLARTLVSFHEALEELDDVQQVFSNEEVDDAVSA
ncbi:MAG TPA: YebC/PmpR family DNA-binding transcriptional regulator [Candidatus Sulfotelmatobacter sp.]|nr:YebC/PmpR family DNA-binding transcriptional regulator [Candidatus Sulfotelmatobacter sp.]